MRFFVLLCLFGVLGCNDTPTGQIAPPSTTKVAPGAPKPPTSMVGPLPTEAP